MGFVEWKGYFLFCLVILEVGVVLRWGKVVVRSCYLFLR